MAKNVIIKHHNELSKEELTYIKELKECCSNKLKLTKVEEQRIKDYETLRKKLETIHRNICYDVMVPVSENPDTKLPLCFIEGKVIHTNEVFIPIGSSYYAKISTIDGIEHCVRRIEGIKDQIEELQEERRPLMEKLVFMQAVSAQGGQVEIIEEYDDNVPEPRSGRDAQGIRIPRV